VGLGGLPFFFFFFLFLGIVVCFWVDSGLRVQMFFFYGPHVANRIPVNWLVPVMPMYNMVLYPLTYLSSMMSTRGGHYKLENCCCRSISISIGIGVMSSDLWYPVRLLHLLSPIEGHHSNLADHMRKVNIISVGNHAARHTLRILPLSLDSFRERALPSGMRRLRVRACVCMVGKAFPK